MTQWISVGIGLLALPAVAAEVRSTETARIGEPVRSRRVVVRGAVDPADLADARTPRDAGDPMIEVEMDKDVYEANEHPTIIVRVKRANQQVVDNASVAVDDDQRSHHATHRGNGEYVAVLDGTPGEHVVDVTADAVIDGTSVHRAVGYSYAVATGHLQILGVGPLRQDDTYLYVPLVVRCTANGFYQFQGTLVAKGTVVAYSQTTASVTAGDNSGMELRFALVDLVEPGPYTLSNVIVQESNPSGQWFATSLTEVGPPFNVRRPKNVKAPAARLLENERKVEAEARTQLLLGPGPLEGPVEKPR